MKTVNKIRKVIIVLVCCCLLLGAFPVAGVSAADEITIPFEKFWDDEENTYSLRPDEITVSLYAYAGDVFSADNAILIDTKIVTAEGGWVAYFNAAREDILDANGDALSLKVVESAVADYEEASHTDPSVSVSGFSIIGDWLRTTTCSALQYSKDGAIKKVVVAKKGSDFIIWTYDELAAADYQAICNSASSVSGFNQLKYDSATIISGTHAEDSGITVNSETISFDATSNWSMFAIGEYSEGVVTVNGAAITNKLLPQTITVSGTKNWDDDNNRDGVRPQKITVNLMNGEEVVDSAEVSAESQWTYTFNDVPKYQDGEEIVYTVSEEDIEGYTAIYNGFNITNKHTPETFTIEGAKTWDDADNQDGIRPDSITVKLMNGNTVVNTATVTEENDWKYTFEDVYKYQDGKEIAYKVVENAVDGYTVAYDDFNITNSHTPETITIEGKKTWDDDNNRDGKRPQSITVNLMDGTKVVDTAEVTAETEWKYTFKDVAKNENGVAISYRITEEAVAGYTVSYNGYNVTNSYTPVKISVSGEKIWNDADNQDGKRPESITVKLMNGDAEVTRKTVTAEDEWCYSFDDVFKYENGQEIEYAVEEVPVAGYRTTYNGYDIINSYTPETITVEGVKTWDDDDDRDGKRPEEITVKLMNGETVVDTAVVTAEDEWTYSFEDVAKYENGNEINYSVAEELVLGYEADYTENFGITNKHTPETFTIEGTKTWDDADNQDGKRPEEITVKLMKGEEEVASVVVTEENDWKFAFDNLYKYEDGKEIEYTVVEQAIDGYEAIYEDFNIINVHTPETMIIEGTKTWDDDNDRDGKRPEEITVKLMKGAEVVATAQSTQETEWKYSFADVPVYENGQVIEYSITEEMVNGYSATYNEYDITNKHTPETFTIEGTKTWDDADDQDGKRPEEITVKLVKGEEVIDSVTVTEKDDWKFAFDNLYKYENGKEIEYKVVEAAVDGYEAIYKDFNITNVYTPESITITGVKVWDDAENQDGKRPQSITVNLMNGELVAATVNVTAEDEWMYTFENVSKYENGKEIEYTITEEEVDGYEAVYDGFDIINTHTPETVTISGKKIWKDNDNQYGKRPQTITVVLLADGEPVDIRLVSEKENWVYKFEDVAKYQNGTEIKYTILEEEVDSYLTTYDGYDIINSHIPGKVTVSVVKKWDDQNDKDKLRPKSVTIQLYADGEEVKGKTVILNEANKWTGIFSDLPEFKDGKKIVYTVGEKALDGYIPTITGNAKDGFVIINTHKVTPVVTPNVPDTGDNASVFFWTIVMMGAVLLVTTEALYQKKKNLMKKSVEE